MSGISLPQIINQHKQLTQSVGIVHCIRNCFKRNTILQNNNKPLQNSNFEYEYKLSSTNFDDKDLKQLLKHLYTKCSFNISDRNLIRRIMLSIFNENIICAAGGKFIKYLIFKEYQKGDKLQNCQKQLYFVVQGKIKTISNNIQHTWFEGSIFGHNELLSEHRITLIHFQKHTICLTLSEQNFKIYFKRYFVEKINRLENMLNNQLINNFEILNKYYLLEQLEQITMQIGTKVSIKSKKFSELILVNCKDKYSKNSDEFYNTYKIIGLQQLVKGKQILEQNIYCLQTDVVFKIDKQKFKMYLGTQGWMKLQKQFIWPVIAKSFKIFGKSQSKQEKFKCKNFLDIKQVKIPYNKKYSPSPKYSDQKQSSLKQNPEFITSFYFIKNMNESFKTQFNKKLTKKTQNLPILPSFCMLKSPNRLKNINKLKNIIIENKHISTQPY